MRFDQLEPLAWGDMGRYAGPVAVGGLLIMLAAALLRVFATDMSDGSKRGSDALFTIGIIALVAGTTVPQVVRALPADDAVKHNAAAVQSWAESEYGVSVEDAVAQYIVKDLRDEGSRSAEFPVHGTDGELKVRIEVISGELQMTAPGEIPKASE